MGLDTVEMVFAVEEYFGLHIPNEAAAKMNTVGSLHDFVYAQLQKRGDPRSSSEVYTQLRDIVAEQASVKVSDIQPDSSFVYDLGMD